MTTRELLKKLIESLPKRQKEIIVHRFGLGEKKPKTLAALGAKYGITRERVRQIEAAALRSIAKSALKDDKLNNLHQKALNHIQDLGGVRREDVLVDDLRFVLKDQDLDLAVIDLLFTIFKKPFYFPENKDFFAFWYTSLESLNANKNFVSKIAKILKGKKEEVISRKKFDDIFYQVVKDRSIPEAVAANFLLNSKKFAVNPYGDFGLAEWPEIVPKTVRDKSYIVLKKRASPLHFREIALEINKLKFDSKKAHPQTVHNELIKDPRFVLVGRGMYALREHGYEPGTAREILIKILKKHGPASFDKIVQLVSEQRVLKNNTILINLQNKKYFKKLDGGLYHLA
jgi:DNA-directed RNA polymerase delta subunit